MIFRLLNKVAYGMPGFFYTIIVLALILLLTLMPVDESHSKLLLFPHADKVVHFLMFGGLAAVFVFDCWRQGFKINLWLMCCAVLLSSDLGGTIELLQDLMGLGRSGDFNDFVADTVGSFVFTFISGYICTRCLKK